MASGFAFHEVAKRPSGRSPTEYLFGASSVITPFFMGTVVGAVASGRVPLGNAEGDPWSSWLNPVSLLVGVLFVATGAYLAAVFLISDARRAGDEDLVRYFAARALGGGGRHRSDRAGRDLRPARRRALRLRRADLGDALPLVIAVRRLRAGRAGDDPPRARRGASATGRRRSRGRHLGLGRGPVPLPAARRDLTIAEPARRPPTTLTMVIIVFVVAAVLVLPSLGLLYALTQRGELEYDSEAPPSA